MEGLSLWKAEVTGMRHAGKFSSSIREPGFVCGGFCSQALQVGAFQSRRCGEFKLVEVRSSGGENLLSMEARGLRGCPGSGMAAISPLSGSLRIRLNGLEYRNLRRRHSFEILRAEARSWHLGSAEIPKAWAFWEAGQNTIFAGVSRQSEMEQVQKDVADLETELCSSMDYTVDPKTPRGDLSPAAINTIEQFSRLNGLTGRKMKANFESLSPVAIQNEARNLVEFCVFRYLGRGVGDVHPSLKDGAFRRLTFTAMLAWQRPYLEDLYSSEQGPLPEEEIQFHTSIRFGPPVMGAIALIEKRKGLVGEEAFVRIAPAIAGAADRPTVHCLFDALVGEDGMGLAFETWDQYLIELSGVHRERKQYIEAQGTTLGLESDECVLSVGNNKGQPVQKWSGSLVWPGRLTLTDRAFYFEANGITSHQKPIRLDLTSKDSVIEKKKVGPFGAELFDSAISVASSPPCEAWVLELVDFGGERRRDIWFAMAKELICLYRFIDEYGPKEEDPLVSYIYGARHGQRRAIDAAIQGIARLQAVQYALRKPPLHPERLLQFSFLADAPSGDLVYQTLALSYWGGRMDSKAKDLDFLAVGGGEHGTAEDTLAGEGHDVLGVDGSVYPRRWMTSPSWNTTKSITFWRQHKGGVRGVVVGKMHVVGGLTHVERAVRACWEQCQLAEKTKATIDGAILKGIPNNVDLVKELMLPFMIISVNFQKLKRWEKPGLSAAFLLFATGLIYKNWLRYVFPAILLTGAGIVFVLRGLKAQGRLGEDFTKVTIRDQPPTNTIQKIMALKEALTALEDFLQNLNITLLKLRTVVVSGDPQSTNEVFIALLVAGLTTWFVPFRYLVGGLLIDQFTIELEFRRKSVEEVVNRVNEWWSAVPATPVAVLPPDKGENNSTSHLPEESSDGPSQSEALVQALSQWLAEDQ